MVDGIKNKIIAAAANGCSVLLCPSPNAAEEGLPADVQVVGAPTLVEAFGTAIGQDDSFDIRDHGKPAILGSLPSCPPRPLSPSSLTTEAGCGWLVIYLGVVVAATTFAGVSLKGTDYTLVLPPLDPGCGVGWAVTLSYIEGGGADGCCQEVQCCSYPGSGRREVMGGRRVKGCALDAVAWAITHADSLGTNLKVRGCTPFIYISSYKYLHIRRLAYLLRMSA